METDPYGMAPHSAGAKLDAGKNRVGLVLGNFPHALWEVCRVGTFGAEKYTDNGWKDVPHGQERYRDAAMRHWLKRSMGEEFDQESGIHHLAHMVWNLLAERELTILQDTADDIEETRDGIYPQNKQTYSTGIR